MKKALVYGTAVLALSAAPLLAQQPSGGSTTSRQGSSSGTTQPGTPGGSSGTQSGTRSGTAPGSSTKSGSPSQASASQSNADHQFVMDAARGGLAEVELGNLAKTKAESEQVKQFADRMVTDHGKANDELKTLAQNKNITLPTEVSAKDKATKDRLEKMSGAAFDRAYMQQMVSDHRKDVSEFQKESKSGKDADVKAWAAKTLPTLQEHMQLAQTASHSAVGTSGTKSSGAKSTGSDSGKTTGGPRGTTGGGTATQPSGGSTSSPGTGTGSSSPR